MTRRKMGAGARALSRAAVLGVGLVVGGWASAAPYASGVVVNGTNGSFVLNEAADAVTITYGNGSSQVITTPAAGTINFTLPSAGSTFSITATKASGQGYLLGKSLQIGSDVAFNAPRGVAVNQNVNSPYFGRVYVSNAAAGTAGTRSLGDGIYALGADLSDVLQQGDTALTGGLSTPFTATNGSQTPYHIEVGPDSNLYIADNANSSAASTTNGTLFRVGPDVTGGINQLFGVGTTAALISSNGHGSIFSSPIVTGSASNGTLSIYAIDGGLNTGSGANNLNSVRRFDLGSTTDAPTAAVPQTQIANLLINTVANVSTDLARGADGKFYILQNRAAGSEAGIFVTDASGNKLWDSLTTTTALGLDGDPATTGTQDLLRQSRSVTISPDDKIMAVIRDDNAIWVIPLIDGIPDLANRQILTDAFPTTVTIGRDVSFDAAGNLYAVSSGTALFRVFSPGGASSFTTSFDGTNYSFANALVPEPTGLAFALGGIAMIGMRRRRA